MTLRAALAVLFLLAAGWLAVAEHGSRAEDRLTDLAFARGSVPPALLAEGEDLARSARRLDPGTRPDEVLSVLEVRAARNDAATARLLRATRREPESSHLWSLLVRAARDRPE